MYILIMLDTLLLLLLLLLLLSSSSSDFNKSQYSRRILEKNSQISKFMKIRPVGAQSFHANGRTRGNEVESRFSEFMRTLLKWSRNCSNIGIYSVETVIWYYVFIYQSSSEPLGYKWLNV
jgi:hypothetical protein